jgi:hypothetical protein
MHFETVINNERLARVHCDRNSNCHKDFTECERAKAEAKKEMEKA